MPPPTRKIRVTREDRVQLKSWLRARNTPHSLTQRAQIVLLAGQGVPVKTVAQKVGMHPVNVYLWRQRYERVLFVLSAKWDVRHSWGGCGEGHRLFVYPSDTGGGGVLKNFLKDEG